MAEPTPEQRLTRALRARSQQLGGAPGSAPAGPAPSTPGGTSRRPPLPAGWVLLIALVLGLLAGAVAGLVTVL